MKQLKKAFKRALTPQNIFKILIIISSLALILSSLAPFLLLR